MYFRNTQWPPHLYAIIWGRHADGSWSDVAAATIDNSSGHFGVSRCFLQTREAWLAGFVCSGTILPCLDGSHTRQMGSLHIMVNYCVAGCSAGMLMLSGMALVFVRESDVRIPKLVLQLTAALHEWRRLWLWWYPHRDIWEAVTVVIRRCKGLIFMFEVVKLRIAGCHWMILGTAGAERGELRYENGLHSFPLDIHNLSFLTGQMLFDLLFIVIH